MREGFQICPNHSPPKISPQIVVCRGWLQGGTESRSLDSTPLALPVCTRHSAVHTRCPHQGLCPYIGSWSLLEAEAPGYAQTSPLAIKSPNPTVGGSAVRGACAVRAVQVLPPGAVKTRPRLPFFVTSSILRPSIHVPLVCSPHFQIFPSFLRTSPPPPLQFGPSLRTPSKI